MTTVEAGRAMPTNLKTAMVKGSMLETCFTITLHSPNKLAETRVRMRPSMGRFFTVSHDSEDMTPLTECYSKMILFVLFVFMSTCHVAG